MDSYQTPDHPISPTKIVADYIIGIRNRGAFLAYSDYPIIASWLHLVQNVDTLLIVLDDILPQIFQKAPLDCPPPSLKNLDKKVEKTLVEYLKNASNS